MIAVVELGSLPSEYHHQALLLIHRTVQISNAADYPPSVIMYQTEKHYTKEWLQKKLKSSSFLVAVENTQIIGTGLLEGSEVKAVFVDPDHQGIGVGKEIMKKIEQQATKLGLTELTLNSSITAIDFYISLGYSFVEERIDTYQDQKIVTYMLKKRL